MPAGSSFSHFVYGEFIRRLATAPYQAQHGRDALRGNVDPADNVYGKDGGTTWTPWLNVTADGNLHDVELWGLAFANGMYWAGGTGARDSPEKNGVSLSMKPFLLSWKL